MLTISGSANNLKVAQNFIETTGLTLPSFGHMQFISKSVSCDVDMKNCARCIAMDRIMCVSCNPNCMLSGGQCFITCDGYNCPTDWFAKPNQSRVIGRGRSTSICCEADVVEDGGIQTGLVAVTVSAIVLMSFALGIAGILWHRRRCHLSHMPLSADVQTQSEAGAKEIPLEDTMVILSHVDHDQREHVPDECVDEFRADIVSRDIRRCSIDGRISLDQAWDAAIIVFEETQDTL